MFKAAQDSTDDNNLDLDQVTRTIFMNGIGLLDRMLWTNDIKAK